MKRLPKVLLSVIFCPLVAVAAANPAVRAPSPLPAPSTWIVTAVEVDRSNQPGWLYHPDDPQLMNRLLELRADGAINFLLGFGGWCERPHWHGVATTLGRQIGRTMSRPPTAGRSPTVKLRDLTPRIKDQAIVAYSITCGAPAANTDRDGFWAGAWIAKSGEQRVYIGMGSEAFLELRRLAPKETPAPSFDCAKAAAVAERQICASPILAGLDRSVALAIEQLSAWFPPGKRQQLQRSQLLWLATRDACQARDECLFDSMTERLQMLDAYRTIPLPP